MIAKYFTIIHNHLLSASSQRKYNFYHQNMFLDASRTNSRSIIGKNPPMMIPFLANQDLTPMLLAGFLLKLHIKLHIKPSYAVLKNHILR